MTSSAIFPSARMILRRLASMLGIWIAFGSTVVTATSTDGFHTNMILPVVVQTASFSSDIYIHNPDFIAGVSISITYYPANGTTAGAAVACGNKAVAAGATNRYTLLALCPGITGSNNFGYFEANEADANNHPYNLFARVDNPSGQGFEIEGFPTHTFTAADATVVGLKRQSASSGFGTNCFMAALAEPTTIDLTLYDATGALLGALPQQSLAPREMRRFLDIFASAGLAAGDYSNVSAVMTEDLHRAEQYDVRRGLSNRQVVSGSGRSCV